VPRLAKASNNSKAMSEDLGGQVQRPWWERRHRQAHDFQQAKAALSARYLTSKRAMRMYENAVDVSEIPEVNVIGVGIGEKISDGRSTGATALKLYVRRKFRKGEIASRLFLPKCFAGLPVDVEEIGRVRPLLDAPDPRITRTPAQPGCSIGFEYPNSSQLMAGTFGALVRNAAGEPCILSNSHVLAFEGRLPIGAPIFQCSLLDVPSGSQRRQIGTLAQFTDLDAKNLRVDAATAKLIRPGLAVPNILGIGKPVGVLKAQANMQVHKVGRTTGYTAGWVMNTDTDILIDYDTGSYTFFNQIVISSLDSAPFCDTGDSGSLILDRASNSAVGLLCAASASHGIANHIEDVLSSLKVDLA
jgi:hypothetical protein